MVLYAGLSILSIDLLPWLLPTGYNGTHMVVMFKGVQTMGLGLCASTHIEELFRPERQLVLYLFAATRLTKARAWKTPILSFEAVRLTSWSTKNWQPFYSTPMKNPSESGSPGYPMFSHQALITFLCQSEDFSPQFPETSLSLSLLSFLSGIFPLFLAHQLFSFFKSVFLYCACKSIRPLDCGLVMT